jgi:hypothetical protein
MTYMERVTIRESLAEIEALFHRILRIQEESKGQPDLATVYARAFGACTSIADMGLFQVDWARSELKLTALPETPDPNRHDATDKKEKR